MVDSPKDPDEGQNFPKSQNDLEHSVDTLPKVVSAGSIRVDDLVLDRSDPGVPAIIASELVTTPEITPDPAADDSSPEEEETKTAKDLISVQQRIPTQVVRAEKALQSGREIRVLEQQLMSTNVYEPDRDPPTVLLDPPAKATRSKTRFMVVAGLLIILLALGVYSQQNQGSEALPLKVEAAALTLKPAPKPRASRSIAVPPAKELEQEPAPTAVGKPAPALAPSKRPKPDQAKPMRKRPAEARKRSQSRRRKLKRTKRVRSADTSAPNARASDQSTTGKSLPLNVPIPARADEKKTETTKPTVSAEANSKTSASPVEASSPTTPSTTKIPVSKYARLIINGPKGTAIQIDMAKVGVLPLPELVLPPGRHSVWAELSGFETQMIDLQLKATERKELKLKLKVIPKATLE